MAESIPLFPVYLYEEDVELPKIGTYYVVAKDGIYIHVNRAVGSALVKATEIPWLKSANTHINLSLPKIPGRIIGQAWKFFSKIYAQYQSESYLQLYYSKKLNQYRLWCPKQTVSFGGVHYDRSDQFSAKEREGTELDSTEIKQESVWNCVGTIHSHCNFSAFHSGTDTADESTFDGIHLTIGHVDREEFSLVSSVAICDNRLQLEPENCVTSDLVRTIDKEVVKSKWMNFVGNDTCFFKLNLSEKDQEGLLADEEMIENEWIPKVEKQQYQQTWKPGSFMVGGNDEDDEKWWPKCY